MSLKLTNIFRVLNQQQLTIGSKWVFKVKRNADGSIERYKGRVVAKGYNQHPGFDYIEIFAPTVRMRTIRVVLAISALHDYHLCSIDISHAYLNGEMDCDVYMEQPEGFTEGDPRQTVCLLQKSIYGTKQGGNRWNKKMRAVGSFQAFYHYLPAPVLPGHPRTFWNE
jgi:hypothetical protein